MRTWALWPAADPPGLVRDCPSGTDTQLFWPGRVAHYRCAGGGEPFLPAGARMGTLSASGIRDGRYHHRISGYYFRRVLAHSAVNTTGIPPRMRVLHTASHEMGQIYIPLVNWLLAAGTLAAVLEFRWSDALGGAYGIAVSMLMAVTTVLAALVALQWGYNPFAVAAVNGFFLLVDLIFVAANSAKLFEGGWFPLLLACIVAFRC